MKRDNEYYLQLCFIAIFLFGLIFIVWLFNHPVSTDLGNLSEWVGSLLTIGVFYTALKQINAEASLNREEREYQEKERRLDLASPIYCYLKDKAEIIIVNNSLYPVYDIIAGIVQVPLHLTGGKGEILNIEEKFIPLSNSDNLYRIHHVYPNSEEKISIPSVGGGCGKLPWVAMAFQDTRGNYWVRESSGKLHEISKYTEYFKKEIPMDIYYFDGRVIKVPSC